MKTEVCNFSKTSGATTGAVGVLTYDVLKNREQKAREKIAIMFSVPYDYNMYDNWVAVGIYEESRQTNKDLYDEMYNKKEKLFTRAKATGSCIKFLGQELHILCTMSPMGRAIMKVEVWDRCFFP